MTAGRCHRQITDGCQLVDSHVVISDTLSLLPSFSFSLPIFYTVFFFSLYHLCLPLLWHSEGESSAPVTCGLFGLGLSFQQNDETQRHQWICQEEIYCGPYRAITAQVRMPAQDKYEEAKK